MTSPRTALVTGSTRGIGRAIALRLARDGVVVVLNHARAGSAAEEAIAAVRAAGGRAHAVRADVTDAAECARLVREATAAAGPIELLVNNVGPFLERPLGETSDAEWRLMIDGNLGSAFWCARAVLPGMRAAGGGVIVNVGALNAEVSPGMTHDAPAYSLAKSALMMMTRSLARTEGPHGIRVNAVGPGFIETEAYAGWDPDEQARWRSLIPLGRFGRPDEVAEAVAFLASSRAAYISGAILPVHGGLWL
ncbi:MAG TPA: SDR family NAD(P)-dependent oxidoreductase [Patescibacteria group bacterium]|nr:SDR family NAD(P)-dependent oxidoreductase [Patescibacteria group bacterium]